MSDIVERLRSVAHTYDEHGVHSEIELEAAAEIENLRAALRGVLAYYIRANTSRSKTQKGGIGHTNRTSPRGAGRKGMMDISAKRAEEVAYNLQLSGISGSTWSATEVEASNMLRALAAENEKLRAALKEVLAIMPVFPAPAKHIVGMADQYNDAITKARAVLGEKE